MDWKPIEAAPKDGARLILKYYDDRNKKTEVFIGRFDPDLVMWRCEQECGTRNHRPLQYFKWFTPTHFMPISDILSD